MLRQKLKQIINYKDKISVSNDDALVFLKRIAKQPKNILVYLDPPYYKQGKRLYLDYYKHNDHANLAGFLKNTKGLKWVLSYDNVEPIRKLYAGSKLYEFKLSYSAQGIKMGSELLTHSSELKLPSPLVIRSGKRIIPINQIRKSLG
jgi:DNA adenine methylase